MVDTHSHVLPGLDHGCPDMRTAVLMAREAADSGITTVVCTPHLPEWDMGVIERARMVIEELRRELETAGIRLDLKLGFEADLSVVATTDLARLSAVTIEGSQGAMILEMPYSSWPPFLEETIFRLATAGFLPVLAHPERNERIQRSSDLLARCIGAGAVAQGTAASLGGEFGRRAERTFHRLLSEGLFSLLASDAHSYRKEGWTMAPMVAALEGRASQAELLTLTRNNPKRLLAGRKPLPVMPADAGTRWRRRIWQENGR